MQHLKRADEEDDHARQSLDRRLQPLLHVLFRLLRVDLLTSHVILELLVELIARFLCVRAALAKEEEQVAEDLGGLDLRGVHHEAEREQCVQQQVAIELLKRVDHLA